MNIRPTYIPLNKKYKDYYPFGMLMPNRIYSDTALTEQAVYNITKYEVVKYDNNFKTGRQRWQGSSGMTTSVADGKLEASSTVVDEDVTVYYHTKPGKKYRLNLDILYGTADSIDVKIHNQGPQTLIYSDANAPEGMNEYEFTAATDSIRLRLKRKDHNHQGALSFYVDRAVLRIIRDTLYQDTVYLATGNNYRYGFNGKEQDPSWNGVGAMYDYGFRIYDPRIARFLSVDPLFKSFPWYSPYQFAGNTPIQAVDLDGLEIFYATDGSFLHQYGTSTEIRIVPDKQVKNFTKIINDPNYNNTGGTDGGIDMNHVKLLQFSRAAYTSAEAAAFAFILAYGAESIIKDKEYAAYIGKVDLKDSEGNNTGQSVFFYGKVVQGTSGEAPIDASTVGEAEMVAGVHTHGAEPRPGLQAEDFSGERLEQEQVGSLAKKGDMDWSDKNNVPLYLGTPKGFFKVYYPQQPEGEEYDIKAIKKASEGVPLNKNYGYLGSEDYPLTKEITNPTNGHKEKIIQNNEYKMHSKAKKD